MATVGQVYYNVLDTNMGTYISSGINVFSDIVASYGAKQFNKLGVQAPPGTRVVLNASKTIMVGRTGMYELDENISITNMYFVRPRKYIKDVQASNTAMEQGTQGMIKADSDRKAALDDFYRQHPTIPDKENNPDGYAEYWRAYNTIQSTYITAYQEALSLFNQGSNGIYVLPNPNNTNAAENYEDLYNIIVDFTYE